MSRTVPTSVLSDALAEAIGGRRVRTALFTTFSFDPAFFELHVLPLLFDRAFSQVEKVARAQLEEAVRELDHLAVIYDRAALSQDAAPATLDVRRIDVRHPTGAFHPKLVLLLVDEPPDPDTGEAHQALVVGALSANLTRAGWWENVECAHFDEIRDRDRTSRQREPFRRDLLGMLRRLDTVVGDEAGTEAIVSIRRFLRGRTVRKAPKRASAAGRWHTRIWVGHESLSTFLRDLYLQRWAMNLEVVSPFFDEHDIRTLEALINATGPAEVRVFLPTDADGRARVGQAQYDAIAERAAWSTLPRDLVARGGSRGGEGVTDRAVHAKIYRFWKRDVGELLVVGSPNLTRAGHHRPGGNVEAAFVVDVGEAGHAPRWWLQPVDADPQEYVVTEPEEDAAAIPIDLTLRYDWSQGTLVARTENGVAGAIVVEDLQGNALGTLLISRPDVWARTDAALADGVADQLAHTSFVVARCDDNAWRVLVREEGMAHKPSLLERLSPAEILRYWSLLSPEQRAALIERHSLDVTLEGIPVVSGGLVSDTDSVFARFAGLFHAFGRLRSAVVEALHEDRPHDAEARLLGAKFDSLPVYLDGLLENTDGDPVQRYVAVLCARQLLDHVCEQWPEFCRSRGDAVERVRAQIVRGAALRAELGLDGDDADAFLQWYEDQFLRWARTPDEEGGA